jgi:hypothetical protein
MITFSVLEPPIQTEKKLYEVLRETKFKQCFGQLHRSENEYCALGVLLHHYGYDFSNLEAFRDPSHKNYHIRNKLFKILEDGGVTSGDITIRNDRRGYSFLDISKYLEDSQV